ncbi:hypothetical protein IWW50_005282 [Coemansia erecta]|nr:hypothetical protein IWW50_005282 [Coemansia erecta]
MFSSLQDALKKLRETRQNEQTQPKRAALVPEPSTQTNNPQPLATASAANGLDDLDMDLDGVDLFEDLVAEDTAIASKPPPGANIRSTQTQSQTPARPATQVAGPGAQTPATNSRPQSHATSGFGSTPTHPRTPLQRRPSGGAQGSAGSQTDMFTTPRREGGSVSRTTITTTVVGKRSGRGPALGPKRQRIPGPAGLVDSAASAAPAATQKPASPFKTPLSRRTHSEQAASVDFEGGTWAAMLDHLNMPTYTAATAKAVARTESAAEWPIRRVLEAAHTQRVRTMLVQLREMGSSDSDASVSVVDPTGEMRASIHRPVMKRFVHFLAAGASIILKDVVALKLPGAPPFLTITAASIEQIFTTKGAGTSENPIMLSATQAPVGTPTHAPPNIPASASESPPKIPVSPPESLSESLSESEAGVQSPYPQTNTHAGAANALDSEHDPLDDGDGLLGDDLLGDEDAFNDLLNSSQ